MRLITSCQRAARVIGVTLLGLIPLAGCTHSSASLTTSRAQPTPASTAPPFTRADASRLDKSLAKGSEASVRSAVALPARQALSSSAVKQLAAVGPVTFDQDTFRFIDARDATIAGKVAYPPAGEPASWTFTLFYTGHAWLIADAEPTR
jgi:hypothetical protein